MLVEPSRPCPVSCPCPARQRGRAGPRRYGPVHGGKRCGGPATSAEPDPVYSRCRRGEGRWTPCGTLLRSPFRGDDRRPGRGCRLCGPVPGAVPPLGSTPRASTGSRTDRPRSRPGPGGPRLPHGPALPDGRPAPSSSPLPVHRSPPRRRTRSRAFACLGGRARGGPNSRTAVGCSRSSARSEWTCGAARDGPPARGRGWDSSRADSVPGQPCGPFLAQADAQLLWVEASVAGSVEQVGEAVVGIRPQGQAERHPGVRVVTGRPGDPARQGEHRRRMVAVRADAAAGHARHRRRAGPASGPSIHSAAQSRVARSWRPRITAAASSWAMSPSSRSSDAFLPRSRVATPGRRGRASCRGRCGRLRDPAHEPGRQVERLVGHGTPVALAQDAGNISAAAASSARSCSSAAPVRNGASRSSISRRDHVLGCPRRWRRPP